MEYLISIAVIIAIAVELWLVIEVDQIKKETKDEVIK